jgi:hypothetical protein
MGRVELTGIVLVCIGAALYALTPEPSVELQSDKPREAALGASAKQTQIQVPVSQTQRRLALEHDAMYVPPSKPKPKQVVVDARYAQMNGLIGESGQWISSVFDNPYWTSNKPNHFRHINGSELRLSLVDGRVMEIRVDFAPKLASPAMQTVVDYALGRATNAPFYLDTLADANQVLTGTFEHKNKHRLRYTAGLDKDDKSNAWLAIEVIQ